MNSMDQKNIVVSLLLPTRGRPDKLCKVFDSISATVADPSRVVLNIYVDDDDKDTIEFSRRCAPSEYAFDVLWHIGQKAGSMGKMVEALYRSSPAAQVYMPMVDDYVFETCNWDELLRDIWKRFPDGVWMAYPHDASSPGNVTFVILGAGWLGTLERYLTDYFPFWFDDVWLDQVAQLVGRKVAAPMTMRTIGGKGKTPRMFNLWFWQQFFSNTLDERIDDADKLCRVIYKDDEEYIANRERFLKLAESIARINRGVPKNTVLTSEYMLSNRFSCEQISRNMIYIRKEAEAVLHLCGKLNGFIGSNDKMAAAIIDTILSSSLPSPGIDQMRHVVGQNYERTQLQDLQLWANTVSTEVEAIRMSTLTGTLPGEFKLLMPHYSLMIILKARFLMLANLPYVKRITSWFRRRAVCDQG